LSRFCKGRGALISNVPNFFVSFYDRFGNLGALNGTSGVIAFDDGGNPADADYDDLVVRFTVSAVPEPATWAMMLLGFAGIGFGLSSQAATRAPLSYVQD
jgi:hypothetical protein